MTTDEKYMFRCLDLARTALGNTAPNPMVGSVIVYNGSIIGEGFHQKYGEAHAEVNAINSVKDKNLLKKSTLYVNLEPCSHFGKTPPCADLIIKMEIPEVVIGTIDCNSLVAGNGIKKMEDAGIKVKTGVLAEDCRILNKRFFTFHEKKRPYIILKWAKTKDGFIDIKRTKIEEKPAWITNETGKILVHKWRTEEQSIMVATNTALLDNPRLDVREWIGNNPLRLVLDKSLRLPQNLNLFDKNIPTIVYTEEGNKKSQKNLEYVTLKFDNSLIENILTDLFNRKIQSVIVEGGSVLLKSFIIKNLWDEARVFTGDVYFKSGIEAPGFNSRPDYSEMLGNSLLEFFYNKKS